MAALALGRFDESQREEDVLVYAGPSECIMGRVRDAASCQSEYETARKAYPDVAPRYESTATCEAHHGPSHCLSGDSVTAAASGKFVPRMAGYMIGRRAEQGLPAQPVFEHAPRDPAHAAGHGGYCTGSGARIVTGSGGRSSAARVSSAAIRSTSFGGFGNTGRSFSSSSRGFFSGG